MTSESEHVRHCTVYSGRGEPCVESLELEPVDRRGFPHHAPDPERVMLRAIMSRDVVCARPDLAIAAVVSLMIEYHVGCIPVVDDRRRPIGIITKFDLCEQLDAAMRAASVGAPLPSEIAAQTADDVMMPIAFTLDEHASIAHAAAMMKSEDTHHVLAVADGGTLVGVVSTKDIVNWVVDHEVLAARKDAGSGPTTWHPLEG